MAPRQAPAAFVGQPEPVRAEPAPEPVHQEQPVHQQPVFPQPVFPQPVQHTAPTPTIADLFDDAPHRPAPAAPGPAQPFAFLPPPAAADRTEAALPMGDDAMLVNDFDSDPELTMIASRRGKTKFWTLDLPDGSVEVVVGTVIVGRAASAVPGRVGARLLSIEDPTRSVSKNHALFTDEHGQLFVEDLDSMNGIVITRTDGHETELVPGTRHRLEHGATVELGDLMLTVFKN